MIVLNGRRGLQEAVGTELGVSPWVQITQAEVEAFADLTGDHQWIHVDVARARASRFGGTIAHGFLTLSLLPRLQHTIYRIEGIEFGLNYGLNRVRFPAPVPVGGRLRLRVTFDELREVPGGLQGIITATFELEGSDKPACVAEQVFRVYGVT